MKLRLADIENIDYMQYANMFYKYKFSTAWSAPEVLSQKSMPTVSDLTPQMDVYSFGILLWEIWHCQVPFDEDYKMANHYVKEKSRPKLV